MRVMKFVTLAVALSMATAASAQGTQQAPAATGGMDKKAISKQCSTQADQQNLHGKARKAFRSKCKASGGKSS